MKEKSQKPIIKTYTNLAGKYDRKFASYLKDTFDFAMKALKLKGDEKILDVACGTGGLEKIILEKFPGQHITGVDITKPMLKIARDRCRDYKNVRFLTSPAQKLPFIDHEFDLVITCSAFHYMRDPSKVLSECQRVLVNGGRFVLIDWCRDFLWAKFYDWLSKAYKKAHYKVYTQREIKRLLTEVGFLNISIDTFSSPPFWRMMCVEAQKDRISKWSVAVGG